MELNHEFTVPAHVDRAWAVLTDIEQIAPCMPGAELTEVDGDTYHGTVKVKVGPITVQYKGTASIVEKDEAAHRVVLKASGRDARGQGNASATVTALMTPNGDSTTVFIGTDLSIAGKVAQFGRGVMSDVSAKLLEQFVNNIEADLLVPEGGAEAAPAGGAAAPADGAAAPAGGAAASGAPASGRPPASRAGGGGEPVRLVGITLKSVMSRLGQAIARFFRRLTGRGGS
jgi:carbon monoxide dehydrogenase subunit G